MTYAEVKPGEVEAYLVSKGIDYRVDGKNLIAPCPFCKVDENNFGIHSETGQFSCFRGKCGQKGNLVTLRRHFKDQPVRRNVNQPDADSAWGEDIAVSSPSSTTRRKVEAIPNIELAHQNLLESFEWLNYLNDERGLSIETVKAAKLGLSKRKFGPEPSLALTFPYFVNGECVGVKYRSLPPEEKDFRFTSGREVGLYRQDVIKKDMEFLLLAEGETDTLSLVENGFNSAIGVPGCKGKKVDWGPMLDLPKKLYLVFDNDEAGQTGAFELATRFGIQKFLNVVIPDYDLLTPVTDKHGVVRTKIKDVNEFFANGHTAEEFQSLLDKARPFDIEGVTSMDSAFDKLEQRMLGGGSLGPQYEFFLPSITARAKGINDGDLIVVLGPAKSGKTTILMNQAEFMRHTYNMVPHFDCMEMDDTDLTLKWIASTLQKDQDTLTLDDIRMGRKLHKEQGNGFNFSRSRPTSLDDYMQGLFNIKKRYDNGLFVIDNFQILVDLTLGRNESNNRPSYMSKVSKTLKAAAGEMRVPIFLISQPKQLQEGQMVGANDSEGSSTLTKDADIFMIINRPPEVKINFTQAQMIGNVQTEQSHSDDMYVNIGLSRRSKGGLCTVKIDGGKSTIREYTSAEVRAQTKQGMIDGIAFTDDNERTSAESAQAEADLAAL